MVFAVLGIGFLGFLVWGHHMFMSGMSPYSALAFSVLTMTIGVPSAIKTFNWIGTLWGGKIRFTTAMLFALGFVSLFVTGGLSGIFLGQPALDLYFHDTYFVVGHFHILRGRALPHDHGRGGHFRHVRRNLLLVPQDVRANDERDPG
jgi:cytochrome c oxidase subunit 1